MSSLDTQSALLSAHPSTPAGAVRSLTVQVRAEAPDTLTFRYALAADLSQVRIPQTRPGARTDLLWQHTCFEAFVGPAEGPGYHEFNFSPSLDWALYRFSAHRTGMAPAALDRAPAIDVRRVDDGLELQSTVCLTRVSGLCGARPWRIGVAAVIEDENGRLSYWALRHPPGKPDFHHPHGFTLEIARS